MELRRVNTEKLIVPCPLTPVPLYQENEFDLKTEATEHISEGNRMVKVATEQGCQFC